MFLRFHGCAVRYFPQKTAGFQKNFEMKNDFEQKKALDSLAFCKKSPKTKIDT